MIRLMLRYRIGPRRALRIKRLLRIADEYHLSFNTKKGEGFDSARIKFLRRIER